MENFIKLTKLVGKVAFCYPVDACPAFVTTKWLRKILEFLNLPKLVQLSLAAYALLSALDNSINNSLLFHTGSKIMSDHIYFFLVYVAIVVSDTLIRASTIYFWRDVSSLSTALLKLDDAIMKESAGKSLGDKSGKFYIFSAVVLSIVMISYAIGLAIVLDVLRADVEFVTCCNFSLLPKNEFVIRCVFVVIDLMPFLSIAFALIFIVTHGQFLINLHTRFIQHFKLLASQSFCPFSCFRFCKAGKLGTEYSKELKPQENSTPGLDEFNAHCIQLQACFANFGRIGGIYSLAIVFQCTLVIIRAVGVMAKIGDRPTFNQTSFTAVHYLACFILIVFLADFGSYLQSKV